MGINLKDLKVNVPKAILEDYVFLEYGRPKAGKTSLFAGLVKKAYGDVNKGLLIGFEQGYNALEVVATPINDYADFLDVVDQLIDEKEELGFKLIGIDTVDEMFRFATSYILKRESRKDGKKYLAVNDIPWGKGWEYIEQSIMEQLTRLKRAGYGLMLISHDKDKKFESRDGVSYDKTTVSLPDRVRNSILNMVDFINFIDIAKEKDATDRLVDKRYIYFRASGADLEAGSRFSNVPERIEYDIDLFLETFENAVKTALNGKDIDAIRQKQEVEREQKAKEFIQTQTQPSNEDLINQIKALYPNAKAEAKATIGAYMKEIGVTSFQEPDKFQAEQLQKIIGLLS